MTGIWFVCGKVNNYMMARTHNLVATLLWVVLRVEHYRAYALPRVCDIDPARAVVALLVDAIGTVIFQSTRGAYLAVAQNIGCERIYPQRGFGYYLIYVRLPC